MGEKRAAEKAAAEAKAAEEARIAAEAKAAEEALHEADSIEGTWNIGTIKGDKLTWDDGEVTQLTAQTQFTLSVMFSGQLYTAELRDDGKLHWSDGDVWEREAFHLDGEGVLLDSVSSARDPSAQQSPSMAAAERTISSPCEADCQQSC